MIRLALVGKGGSGKSVIAGTVARLLARDRHRVLALDIDTLPGLAFSIGLGRIPDAGMPEALGERREGQGWVLREDISAEALVDRYALDGPDGIRFLQLGKLPGHVRPGSTVAFRHVVESFHPPGWSIVGDLAAGTRQGFAGWAGFASLVAIVAEPTEAAFLSVRRLAGLAETMPGVRIGVVLSKIRGEVRIRTKVADLGIPVWAEIPYDESVALAEREGVAPIDAAPECHAMALITGFTARLCGLAQEGVVV